MTNLRPNNDSRLNKPFMTSIIKIREESPRVKSFTVKYNPLPQPVEIHPGQFVMVWIPGVDEIPMSVSHIGPQFEITISVAEIGEATKALHQLNIGDQIGIRGPYGNWYQINNGTAIIIGGGIGMASVLPIIQTIKQKKQENPSLPPKKMMVIEGAKTEQELLYLQEIEEYISEDCKLFACTDDGSYGYKGFTTDKFENLLQLELETQLMNNNKDLITVYACGPEIMLWKLFQLCEKYKVQCQISLERMMRCGFGICGLCALEPTGMLVCRDGPIFTSEALRNVTDFGNTTREFSGKPKSLKK